MYDPVDRTAAARRRGLTVLELLVVVAVLSVLMAILLPAINAAREAARGAQCMHQLRQTGFALHNHHSARGHLPAGWSRASDGISAYGWAVRILPYLEEKDLSRDVNIRRPITCTSNAQARQRSLENLICPSDITAPSFALYRSNDEDEVIETVVDLPTSSYVGVFGTVDPLEDGVQTPVGDGAFGEHKVVSFRRLQRGLSKTVIVGERTMARLPASWIGVDFRGDEAPCRLIGVVQTEPNSYYSEDDDNDLEECEFDSRHPNGAYFLWADGHVALVSDDIDTLEYRRMSRVTPL